MSDIPTSEPDDDTTEWPDPQPDPDEEPDEDWAKGEQHAGGWSALVY